MGQRRHGGLLKRVHVLELVGLRKHQRHVDMDRGAVIRLHHADGCCHQRAPVAARGDPAGVAEASHQNDPGVGDRGDVPAPFGVKVCALEPGGMRTNWGARANQDTPELLPDYEPSVGAVAKALKSYWGKEVSDPVKVAQVVLRLAASDSLPAHLLIGSDAVRFAGEAEKTREVEAAQWRQMSLSTDVDSSTVLPDMRF